MLKKPTKIMFSLLLSLVFVFTIASSAFAATVTIGPIGFQSTNSNNVVYKSWYVTLPNDSGSLNIGLALDQYGIHTGQQASVKYTLSDFSGSSGYSQSQTVTGDKRDYTYPIFWTGLTGGRTYLLTAENVSSYDSVVQFKVTAPAGTSVTS